MCFLHSDLEVANRHGHTCLMIACYKGHLKIARYLIELGADVNRKSVKGNTALHDCAESGSLEILQLLLSSGAKMDVDSYGMTPLLAAAVSGHTHIVDHVVSNLETVTRKDKIDALELLGATFVDRKRDMTGALEYWKRAMGIRYYFNSAIKFYDCQSSRSVYCIRFDSMKGNVLYLPFYIPFKGTKLVCVLCQSLEVSRPSLHLRTR